MDDQIPSSPPGDHPTPEQLYRARRGPRNAEAERHLAHAVLCAECSAELARLEAFDDPEELSPGELDAQWERFGSPRATRQPENRPERQPERRGRPPFQQFALAAAAVLALSMGFGLWSASQTVPPSTAEVTGDTVRGGEEAAGTFQPAGVLTAPPAEIVFPAADGTPLRVTVYDSAREYTWTSPEVTNGRVALPAGEQRKLRPGVDYYWTVLGDETVPAQTFRIAAPNPPGADGPA
jgi:hypothetical protein